MRLRWITGALVLLLASRVATAVGEPIEAFITRYCAACHNQETHEGGLDFSSLARDAADPQVFGRWVKIHDRVRGGEMPPKSEPRPDSVELAAAVDALTAKLTEADLVRRGSDGRATLRRLTRTELEYTLQDVFALPGVPIKADLPEEGIAAGFDKLSEALDVSHVQMARYLETAQFVLDRAIATRPDAPKPLQVRIYAQNEPTFHYGLWQGECVLLKDKKPDPALPIFSERANDKSFYYTDLVVRPSRSALGMFRSTDEAWSPGFPHFSPLLPGRYKFRLSLWSFQWDKGKVLPSPKTQMAMVRNERGESLYLDAPSLESKVHEFEMWLEPNEKLSYDLASIEHVEIYSRKGQAKEYTGPGIAIDWLDVEGPLYDEWPPESHRRIFGDLPLVQLPKTSEVKPPPRWSPPAQRRRDSSIPPNVLVHGRVDGVWTVQSDAPQDDAVRLLRPLLTKLFRRPLTKEQLARYTGLVADRMAAGEGFEEAMRMAISAAICSPEFLFRLEKPGRLDDWAVANRLSYSLWNSPPDEKLAEQAAGGSLKRGGDTMRQQARRLLADPRSERFLNDFLGQWLALKEIAATTPDKQLYPDFIPYMQDCMVGETRAFIRKLIDANLGVRHLVQSDFAMLNAELAELYGIDDGPSGHELQLIALPPGSHRGGLLTHASILKITANGTNTSPVKRGAWIMDRLLGKPPDPPPANIAAVEPDLRGTTTIRQQLDAHRNNALCASCHRRIDPPGFALESYDVIGRWRDRYRSKEQGDRVDLKVGEGHYGVNFRLSLPVDCTGQTVDGEPFANIEEFKELLLKDERQLARNFVRRLATYATGREISFADRPAIEAILDKCEVKDARQLANFGNYRLRSLIEELAASDLFLTK